MRISVFGTGSVGTAIASKLRSLGYDVVFGSRNPGGKDDGVNLLSYEDAAVYGDWVVNALHGEDAMDIFPSLDLGGKVLIDLGNFLHSIDAPLTETLGESLQRALPEARVVKAMNFPSAHLMGHPEKLEGAHSVFIAGNDDAARAEVTGLLNEFGWRDIIELGDLTACRAMESLAPMWVRLNDQLGHVWFNLAVVRRAS